MQLPRHAARSRSIRKLTSLACFQTPRLLLETITTDDAALLLAVWNDPAFVRFVIDRGIRNETEARAAIVEGPLDMYARYGYGPYRIRRKSDRVAIGICGLFRRPFLDDPDLGYAVLPRFRGQGYAGEAARQMLVIAALVFGLPRVKALIAPANAASIQLIEKLGFRLQERCSLDAGSDTLLYERLLDQGR